MRASERVSERVSVREGVRCERRKKRKGKGVSYVPTAAAAMKRTNGQRRLRFCAGVRGGMDDGSFPQTNTLLLLFPVSCPARTSAGCCGDCLGPFACPLWPSCLH